MGVAHPVLLDEPLAARAGQVPVLPAHLGLTLLQQRRQLARFRLHFEAEEVEGSVGLDVLRTNKKNERGERSAGRRKISPVRFSV